jgi:hypothetical protein
VSCRAPGPALARPARPPAADDVQCHRTMVPGATISRIAARPSIGSVPASRASNARPGHVSPARALGRSRPATAGWCRSMRISASFRYASRRDKPSSDTARETIRKISFNPTSRRSSHLRSAQDRPDAYQTLDRAMQGLCPDAQVFGTLSLVRCAAPRMPIPVLRCPCGSRRACSPILVMTRESSIVAPYSCLGFT